MRKFTVLLRKELRELITMQMLLPLAIVVIMFAAIGGVVGEETEDAQAEQQIAIVDLDASELSGAVLSAIDEAGFDPVTADAEDAEGLVDEMQADEIVAGLLIPAGFGEGVGTADGPEIETFSVIRSFSLVGAQSSERLGAVLAAINSGLSDQLISEAAPEFDPATLKQPVTFSQHVILGDATAAGSPTEVLGFVTSQTTFIPIVLFIVIVFAAQMIATTIASEKENKTLETLLASPITRASLVTSKMVAAAIVALASAAAYVFGLNYYIDGVTGGMGEGFGAQVADTLGLSLAIGDWVLLGVTLFVSILVALAIAVILGAFAENVKAVQSLLAPLMILVMIPYFLTLFIDLEQTGPIVRWIVLAIPFSHAFRAAPNLFLNDYAAVAAGIGYQLVWFAVLVTVAARIFSSDRILTMKLNLRRKRS